MSEKMKSTRFPPDDGLSQPITSLRFQTQKNRTNEGETSRRSVSKVYGCLGNGMSERSRAPQPSDHPGTCFLHRCCQITRKSLKKNKPPKQHGCNFRPPTAKSDVLSKHLAIVREHGDEPGVKNTVGADMTAAKCT